MISDRKHLNIMKSTTESKYLDAVIYEKADPSQETSQQRISSTIPILYCLDIFWNLTNYSRKWKLLVYNWVIIHRLLCALESLQTSSNHRQYRETAEYFSTQRLGEEYNI